MLSGFDRELNARLARIHQEGLHRELRPINSPQRKRIRVEDTELLNFSSNDYLGFANEPSLKEAAIEAVRQFGAGAGASRLISGSFSTHQRLDEALASFKGTEAALSFSSGYSAALGTIPAVVGPRDVIVVDKLIHASIIDAARLSGAKLRVFRHNDLNALEDILRWADQRKASNQKQSRQRGNILLVTESVFSMDGDIAPLADIVRLKEKYGAWLMVDEAHATGIYGPNRRGLIEAQNLSSHVEIQMGTLGKALGAAGGFIAGSRALVDHLINQARSFIFSTAPVPAAVGAATEGIRLIQSSVGAVRRDLLTEVVSAAYSQLEVQPRRDGKEGSDYKSAIIPLMIGNEARTVAAASQLRDAGIFAPAIRYPTVARGKARLRISLTALHTEADIVELKTALEQTGVMA